MKYGTDTRKVLCYFPSVGIDPLLQPVKSHRLVIDDTSHNGREVMGEERLTPICNFATTKRHDFLG